MRHRPQLLDRNGLGGIARVSIDASEAIKHKNLAEYYFGNLDPNRVAFSVGRDIKLGEDQYSPRVNYFIHPVVRVDGIEHADVSRQISFRALVKDSQHQMPRQN